MKQWFQYTLTKVVLLLLLFSIIENIVQYRHTLKLRGFIASFSEKMKTNVNAKNDATLTQGEAIPKAQFTDIKGNIVMSSILENKLLFVYSSSCPACTKNSPNWKDIEKKIGNDKILYLSTDSLQESERYARQIGVEARTLVFLNNEEKAKFKIFRIPQTVHVSNGKIEKISVGVLSAEEILNFQSVFN